jgi:hypothetical protein
MSQSVSRPLQSDVRFLLYPLPASPLHDLAAWLPRREQGGLTTFHMRDIGTRAFASFWRAFIDVQLISVPTEPQSILVTIRVISRSLSIFFNTSFRSSACSAYFCWATLSDWSTASTLRVSACSSSEAARREVWCLIRSADPAHQRCPLAPVSLTASSRRLSVESE